jgi:hypothetical protein
MYFSEEPDPQSAVNNFEQNTCVVTTAMGYPFPDVCNAVIGFGAMHPKWFETL